MTLKRKSTEMDETNWIALEKVAASCGCLYSGKPAHSDAVGHLFQSLSDSIPGLSDSGRSEATL